MKAAIYTRVSTHEQTTEQQISPCKTYCENRGWEYDIFEDYISGAKQSRTDLDNMLKGVRAGEYGAVVVWKLDRLGRSTMHLLQLLEEFRNKEIELCIVTMGINTKQPEGRLFFTIVAGFAELEREFIRQRVKASVATKKAKGIRLGRPPGAKDKKPRRKSGYVQRWASKPRKNQSWYQKEKEMEVNNSGKTL